MAEIPNEVRNKRDHGTKKHCSRLIVWMKQNQTGADVRPIGIADDHQLLPAEVVSFRGGVDEMRKLSSAKLEILHIKHSLRETAKETRHPVLQSLAPHAEERRARPQFISQRQEVILISSGPMQQQKGDWMRRSWLG